MNCPMGARLVGRGQTEGRWEMAACDDGRGA